MFAIAFDLDVDETLKHHPKSVPQAYADSRSTLKRFDFVWRQRSVYTTENEDMASLFGAVMALKAVPWFAGSVRDIRAFRVEMWSDFTPLIKP